MQKYMSVGSTPSQSTLTKSPATHLSESHFYIMLSCVSEYPHCRSSKVMCDQIFMIAQIIFI